MTKRILILSAYGQGCVDCFNNEALKGLVGRFVDELKPWEKLLYDDEGGESGDLWYADFDTETHTLSTNLHGDSGMSVTGPGLTALQLLPALNVLMDLSC